MKKFLFTVIFFAVSISTYSQKKWDTKIILDLTDTAHLYERVKFALVKWKFELQNDKEDTIVTSPRSIYNPSGYAIIQAVIEGSTVVLSGWYKDLRYGLKEIENTNKINLKTYKKIAYFPNSSTWRLLENVAEEIKNNEFIYKAAKKNETQINLTRKSKEVRLRELKDLLEKELITKDDYERAKQKILDEND